MKSFRLLISIFSSLVLFNFVQAQPIFAQVVLQETSTATLSATVVDQGLTSPPLLLTPSNNASLNYPNPTFSFVRATAVSGISHYDLYMDNLLVAANINDLSLNQDSLLYSSYRVNDVIYINLKQNITEGYHSWYIMAFNNAAHSQNSEVWNFNIDTTTPQIVVEKIAQNNYSWDTKAPNSLPNGQQTYISIDTNSPLIAGKVEAYANLKLSLVCPAEAQNCNDQTVTINSNNGQWEHRFYSLQSNLTYLLYIMATDSANNTTNFPILHLTYYQTTALITTPTITISQSSAQSSQIVINQPSQTIHYLDQELLSPPSPPNFQPPTIKTPTKTTVSPGYYWLIIFGLIIHLLMTIIGAGIRLMDIPTFISILFFPYLGKKRHYTVSFATIIIYELENLKHEIYSTISDVKGKFNLPTQFSKQHLIKISRPGCQFKVKILPANLEFPITVNPEKQRATITLTLRIIPLLFAILTSLYAVIVDPQLGYLAYLFISSELLYSEYLYPKLS